MNLSAKKLDAMIKKATVDCYDELEQTSGFFRMIEGHLAVPFAIEVLGVEGSVVSVEMMITEASKQCASATANGNYRPHRPRIAQVSTVWRRVDCCLSTLASRAIGLGAGNSASDAYF
jgi:hypothetical protein